jgi:fructosamine-3-kinase
MTNADMLAARLADAGITDVETITELGGGVVAVAGLVTRRDGSQVFAKTLNGPDSDVFEVEAEGLRTLRSQAGVNTPAVLLVTPNLLVLRPLAPRQDDSRFWERLAHAVAALHTATASDRFGWHRDGWLGRLRQENTWDHDGHSFFAQRRILRWLPEPKVHEAFDRQDRLALERLCVRLPELIPARPASLTHGDLWSGNILADLGGAPALVDPAVSYTWPEVDLSMLWCGTRPPESESFFSAYAELVGLEDGWRERMPLLHLRELLSIVAHGDDDWGAADAVRTLVAPFRPAT